MMKCFENIPCVIERGTVLLSLFFCGWTFAQGPVQTPKEKVPFETLTALWKDDDFSIYGQYPSACLDPLASYLDPGDRLFAKRGFTQGDLARARQLKIRALLNGAIEHALHFTAQGRKFQNGLVQTIHQIVGLPNNTQWCAMFAMVLAHSVDSTWNRGAFGQRQVRNVFDDPGRGDEYFASTQKLLDYFDPGSGVDPAFHDCETPSPPYPACCPQVRGRPETQAESRARARACHDSGGDRKDASLFIPTGQPPEPGCLAIYQGSSAGHVGLVLSASPSGSMVTIEGNSRRYSPNRSVEDGQIAFQTRQWKTDSGPGQIVPPAKPQDAMGYRGCLRIFGGPAPSGSHRFEADGAI
jgi:hypothetical protein